MNFIRRISRRQLLALCAALAVAVAGTAAVAMATGSGGPKPPAKPLADAIHDGLAAPKVPGFSARIKFTNNLIDASSVPSSDPLLKGASGRLWASPDGKLRLELQSDGGGGDSQLLIDGDKAEFYDSATNTDYRGTLPAHHEPAKPGEQQDGVPSVAAIEKRLTQVMEHATLSGATPSDVAGRPTYTVRIGPKHDGGLLGGAELAWDADHGTPLRAAVYSSDSSSPVLQIEATDVSFDPVSASVFDISAPPGAKVVTLSPQAKHSGAESGKDAAQPSGVDSVANSLPFKLVSPPMLVGLPRAEVRGITIGDKHGAVVTYGQGLGGIAVIETGSGPVTDKPASSAGASLPKVSINGVQGQELDTALGTVIRFSRGGVDYVVIGSVPPTAAEAAARGL